MTVYPGYLKLGDVELANNARTAAHAEHGICSRNLELLDDGSWKQTHEWLGDGGEDGTGYITPELTGAPWVDETRPESLEFGGLFVTSIEGLSSTEIEQEITESVSDGGTASVRRLPTRPVTVNGALFASTSRGLQWGIRWLTRSLLSSGCSGDASPRDLTFLESHPGFIQSEQTADIAYRVSGLTRQLTRVVATKTPEINEQTGTSMLRGDTGPCTALVEFELTALVPLIWRSPESLLERRELSRGEELSTRFQELDEDGHCPADCDDEDGVLIDPNIGPMWTLPRPSASGAEIGCQLLDSRRSVFTIPEGLIPVTGEMLPTVTVRSGTREERHLRVRWARGLVTDDGAALDCQTVGEAMITYMPAESSVVLDGRSGTAVAHTADGRELDATPVTVGRAGGPWRAPVLRCGAPYTVVIDADVPTMATVEITGVTGEV